MKELIFYIGLSAILLLIGQYIYTSEIKQKLKKIEVKTDSILITIKENGNRFEEN